MTRGQKIGVVGGGVAVAGLLVGLLIALKSPVDHSPRHRRVGGPVPQTPDKPTGRATTPATTPTMTTDSDNPTPETGDDNYVVREHTSDEPRRPLPLQPFTVAQIRTALQPMYRKCAAPLRGRVPPIKGRLILSGQVKVAGGRVLVTDVSAEQRNLDEPEFVDCVTKALLSVQFDTPSGQPDVEHGIKLPFTVP